MRELGDAVGRGNRVLDPFPLGRDPPSGRNGVVYPKVLDVDRDLGPKGVRNLPEGGPGSRPRGQDHRLGEANNHARGPELVGGNDEGAHQVRGCLPAQALGEKPPIIGVRAELRTLSSVRGAPHGPKQEKVEHTVGERASRRYTMGRVDWSG